MAGLDPAIHAAPPEPAVGMREGDDNASLSRLDRVDGRVEPGHDGTLADNSRMTKGFDA